MILFICLISLFAVLNIVLYLVCRPAYRDVDARRISEGSLKVISESMLILKEYWAINILVFIIFLLIFLFASTNMDAINLMIGVMCIISFYCLFPAVKVRGSYYNIDAEGLSHIKNMELEWSHAWTEIKRATKTYIHSYRNLIQVYDIETKKKVKHCGLPPVLGRYLKEHVSIDEDKLTPTVTIMTLLVIAFIVYALSIG